MLLGQYQPPAEADTSSVSLINRPKGLLCHEDACKCDGNISDEVERGLWMTIIHELRHLLLDTNIVLCEDAYPTTEAAEDMVEAYCRMYYEAHFV